MKNFNEKQLHLLIEAQKAYHLNFINFIKAYAFFLFPLPLLLDLPFKYVLLFIPLLMSAVTLLKAEYKRDLFLNSIKDEDMKFSFKFSFSKNKTFIINY